MSKIALLTFILISVVTASFSHQRKNGYRINGSAVGLRDSSLLYLEYYLSEDDKRIDSAYVVNEKFSFTGELKSNVIYALIRTHDFKNYKFLWLENSIISFKAENGKFRSAVITGSKTQDDQNELDSTLMPIEDDDKNKEKYISFINNHRSSIISGHLLSGYGSTWGKETITPLYEKLSPEIKSSSYGQNILQFISLNKDLKVGDKYIDFSQDDAFGRTVKLSDFHGKVVLLEFWGSWCGPCRQGNPELVKIYDEFKDRGFEILGVGAEKNREPWIKAIKVDKLSWTNVTDLKGDKNKAALIYGVSYYPTNFLIDKTGTIISRDLTGNALRERLSKILLAD